MDLDENQIKVNDELTDDILGKLNYILVESDIHKKNTKEEIATMFFKLSAYCMNMANTYSDKDANLIYKDILAMCEFYKLEMEFMNDMHQIIQSMGQKRE